MFRRHESALPKDFTFGKTLAELGYFINDKDEIRSIENPKAYFKFFLSKNERKNLVQREAMNEAIRSIIMDRLENELHLQKMLLPFGAKPTDPHVPILCSANLTSAKRVIVLFYEYKDDLGILAHRIVGGQGGINMGSVINLVQAVQKLATSPSDPSPPAIILANMGQLLWWRRGKKAITQASWFSLPQKSAVDAPFRLDPRKNTIPENRNRDEHCAYIFNTVIKTLCPGDAKIDVIGVADGATKVSEFLNTEGNWAEWGERMEAFAALASVQHKEENTNPEYAKWLADRGRVFLASEEPINTFLLGPSGTRQQPGFGCPVHSLGPHWITELLLPHGYQTVLDWFQDVAAAKDYKNPVSPRHDEEDEDKVEVVETWADWTEMEREILEANKENFPVVDSF